MKNIVFIGAYDKTDMLLYIAKILTLLNKKVILIDTTTLKKSRYIVPTMSIKEKKYITTYEDVDVAVGFKNFDEIKKYQMDVYSKEEGYDYALYDIDRIVAYKNFKLTPEDSHYFVTSFDMFSLRRGIQVLYALEKGTLVSKVYFTKSMVEEEDKYLNYLTKNLKIKWNKENIVFFPFETDDLDAIYINQRVHQISMRGLSNAYIEALMYLTEEISKEKYGKIQQVTKFLLD